MVNVRRESFPIAGTFAISRGAKTQAEVVVAEISDGTHRGRGECVPYARYEETIESVMAAVEEMGLAFANGLSRKELQSAMPAGAARNALDCALWDLESKRAGQRAFELAGLAFPKPLVTAYTISIGMPDAMAEAAQRAAHRPLLKVKLGAEGDPERIAAVRRAAPMAELIADANEGWTPANLDKNLRACAAAGVTLVEQPLPANDDAALAKIVRAIPVCADESVHDRASLKSLVGKYDAVNIKLDKTGGLTEALAMADAARALNFSIMVGCMVATSLSIAPAILVAQGARVVDLDGALLLAKDRPDGLRYDGSTLYPSSAALWG
ncbi:MAG TPA: N-acetyl-D-Glu racemase DgcA [Xanthobacteraceae bacterium]|nr:N-acetyl-D-Glu racemase DgcA [Xanthobacteraceae bacterium]